MRKMQIKRNTSLVTAGVLAIMLAMALAVLAPVTAHAASAPTITTSGAGSIAAEPDMATVQLGVTIQERNPQLALTRNNTVIADVLEAVRALGIPDGDIQTQHFSMHQVIDWSAGRSTVTGYSVSNSISVVVRDLDMVGDVIGAGVANGANISGGVMFGFTNASELYYQALALAIQDARNKADAMAAALGTSIVSLVSAEEASSFLAPTARSFAGGAAPMAVAEADWSVPMQPGELAITARVQVVFAVR